MTVSPDEIERRRSAALDAIRGDLATVNSSHGVTLFVSHHLEAVGDDFWLKHCGVERPEPAQILDALVLQSHWNDDDGIDAFDFTLPDNVTNYVVSVKFDENGDVSSVNMES